MDTTEGSAPLVPARGKYEIILSTLILFTRYSLSNSIIALCRFFSDLPEVVIVTSAEASTSSVTPSSHSQSKQPIYAASDHLRIRNGVINPELGKEKLTLTVNTREIDVFNVTVDDLKYLESITEIAYFSHKNRKMTNVDVRNSRYTKTVDLNLDMRNLMKKMAIGKSLIKPYNGSAISTSRQQCRKIN